MAEILKVVPSRATERQRVAEEVAELAAEVLARDGAIAMVLERLAESVRQGRHDEAKGYAAAIDPRATAETIHGQRSPIWGFLEVARNVLVFAPIAVTWYGLSVASDAYSDFLAERPELVSQPFLALWQQGFGGAPGVPTFSTVALIDALLIALLILLSMFVHFRSDVSDPATRTRSLLRESRVRTLLAAASHGPARPGVDAAADALLDQLVAEEQRVYERASERERELADLGSAVSDLRRAAADLARAAEDLRGSRPVGR